jgi:ferredoxin-NADP reductase
MKMTAAATATASLTATSRVRKWINESLFNTADARTYFEPLISALSPTLSLTSHKATLSAIQRETPDTCTFDFRPHGSWTGFRPGQHIDITVDINGRRLTRTFSIASTPRHWLETGLISLTIKRNDSGKVSRWLQEKATPGLVMSISEARGDFLRNHSANGLDTSNHPLFLAAGSGLTPVMSHLRALVEPPAAQGATLIYYTRTPTDTLFTGELRAMADAHPAIRIQIVHTGDSQTDGTNKLSGRIDASHVSAIFQGFQPSVVMACGPLGFVDAARVAVADAGYSDLDFISEAFGGARPAPQGNGHSHQISFAVSGKEVAGSNRVTLLDLAEENGLRPNAGCRMGICHTCKCTKVSGKVRNIITQDVSEEENESIQLCVSVAESDLTLSA